MPFAPARGSGAGTADAFVPMGAGILSLGLGPSASIVTTGASLTRRFAKGFDSHVAVAFAPVASRRSRSRRRRPLLSFGVGGHATSFAFGHIRLYDTGEVNEVRSFGFPAFRSLIDTRACSFSPWKKKTTRDQSARSRNRRERRERRRSVDRVVRGRASDRAGARLSVARARRARRGRARRARRRSQPAAGRAASPRPKSQPESPAHGGGRAQPRRRAFRRRARRRGRRRARARRAESPDVTFALCGRALPRTVARLSARWTCARSLDRVRATARPGGRDLSIAGAHRERGRARGARGRTFVFVCSLCG